VTPRRHRDRFAFFGQLNPFKGVDILLDAMRIATKGTAEHVRRPALARTTPVVDAGVTPAPHLWVHGANLELRDQAYQDRFNALLASTSHSVTMVGRYEQSQLSRLMSAVDWVVIPSIWFENSPLVIQEAFHHGRPVICSDIGGMAEKITDDVDGLHFRVRDAHHLAEVITRAATEPGLWDRLHQRISRVHSLQQHTDTLSGLYSELLSSRREVARAR
jgi:glycosyltransferase involved in cell wall biosynthesis